MKLRGPGDLEGTQQSGIAFALKVANITRDSQLLKYVRDIAILVIKEDPQYQKPENKILWKELDRLYKKTNNWGVIS